MDSLLLSLRYTGCVRQDVTLEERRATAAAVRQHLVEDYGLPPNGDPYLAHDTHLEAIFDSLRLNCPALWVDHKKVCDIELMATVFDRFNGRLVEGQRGELDEIVPTEPVRVRPLRLEGSSDNHPAVHLQVQLYSYTHRDGSGWHYEWISATA